MEIQFIPDGIELEAKIASQYNPGSQSYYGWVPGLPVTK